jgi:hypothetical protein
VGPAVHDTVTDGLRRLGVLAQPPVDAVKRIIGRHVEDGGLIMP